MLFGDIWRVEPLAFWDIEGIVVFKDIIIVASIYEDFVAVNFHGVEGASIRHYLFEVNVLEFVINSEERIVEFIPRFTFI